MSNLIVAALLMGSTVYGPSVVSYFPRPLAGALLAHLGRYDDKTSRLFMAGLMPFPMMMTPPSIFVSYSSLGSALVADAVVYTWHSTDVFEYIVIWAITLFMILIGFMEVWRANSIPLYPSICFELTWCHGPVLLQGLGIGVLLACGTFVAQGSRVNPIHAAFPGDGMRSKEIRSKPQRKLLDFRMQGVVYVIR